MRELKKTVDAIKLIALFLFPCIIFGMASFNGPVHIPIHDHGNAVNDDTITLSCPKDIYPTVESREIIEKWIDCFNSVYPDIVVKVEFDDRDYWDARCAAKNIGDVFFVDDSEIYNLGRVKKYLMPLDNFSSSNITSALHLDLDDVYSVFRQVGMADGRMYMVGEIADVQTFTYNKSMLKDAGLEKPADNWTFSEFKEYIKALTVTSDSGKILQVGAAMNIESSRTYIPFCMNKYSELIDYKYYKFNISDRDVVNGVQSFADVLMKKYIYPLNNVCFNEEYSEAFSDINSENIITKAAFISLDSYTELDERGVQYDKYDIDWDIVSYPLSDDGKSLAYSSGYGVFSYTENPRMAAALCFSLWSPEYQTAMLQFENRVSVLKSVNKTAFLETEEYPDKNYGAFYENLEYAVPGEIKGAVPEKIGIIINEGMSHLFNEIYDEFYDSEDYVEVELEKIEITANEKWDVLTRPAPKYTYPRNHH